MDDKDIEFKLAQQELKEAFKELRKFEGKSQGAPYCSFCRRGKGQYCCLIEGNSNVRICDRCVMEANSMIQEELNNDNKNNI